MKQVHALVVEGNLKNLGVLTRLLSRQGIVCSEASNIIQLALVLETLTSVDVVFFDMEFPGADSDDLLRQLKTDARFNGVPFVGLTAQHNASNLTHHKGFHSFLYEPVDEEKFPEQIRHIMNGEAICETGT